MKTDSRTPHSAHAFFKQLCAILRLEVLGLLRNNIHIVLLATLAVIIIVFYILPASLQDSFMPVMLSFEVSILAFLFIAVGVFQEKEEGIHRALRTTPLSSIAYIASKLGLWTVISLLYGTLMSLATLHIHIDYLQIALLIFTQTLILGSLGLIIALFFSNLSDWFIPGVLTLSLNMLPVLSLRLENFSPAWFRIVPGYHALSAFSTIFREGSADVNFPALITFSLTAGILLLSLCTFAVHKKLLGPA